MPEITKLIIGLAYTSDCLFGLLVLGSIYKLTKRSKGEPFGSYIYVGLSGLICLITDIISYTSHNTRIGHAAIRMVYFAFLWLSCITVFISMGRDIANREKSTARISKLFGYFAYFWAALTTIIGIVLVTLDVSYGLTYSPFNEGYVDNELAWIHYVWMTVFTDFCGWGYVVIFFVLFGTFFAQLKAIGANNSMFTFGTLATIPVITETVFKSSLSWVSNPEGLYAAFIAFFIFNTAFSVSAMITVLIYRNRWVIPAEEQEDKVEVNDFQEGHYA
jgi:hypothetical protein